MAYEHSKTFKEQRCTIFTDNQNAAIICGKGSTSLRLHQLALDIFCFCLQNIILQVQWIPRSLMYADNISRIIDHDAWSITSEFYDHLNSMYGPFTLDCFASSNIAKCSKFYSKFWCPGTSGVDAFSFDWSNENCWLVPPVYLSLVFTSDISISQITKDKFSSEVYKDKAERIFF